MLLWCQIKKSSIGQAENKESNLSLVNFSIAESISDVVLRGDVACKKQTISGTKSKLDNTCLKADSEVASSPDILRGLFLGHPTLHRFVIYACYFSRRR